MIAMLLFFIAFLACIFWAIHPLLVTQKSPQQEALNPSLMQGSAVQSQRTQTGDVAPTVPRVEMSSPENVFEKYLIHLHTDGESKVAFPRRDDIKRFSTYALDDSGSADIRLRMLDVPERSTFYLRGGPSLKIQGGDVEHIMKIWASTSNSEGVAKIVLRENETPRKGGSSSVEMFDLLHAPVGNNISHKFGR